jgi:hypothetical protein
MTQSPMRGQIEAPSRRKEVFDRRYRACAPICFVPLPPRAPADSARVTGTACAR